MYFAQNLTIDSEFFFWFQNSNNKGEEPCKVLNLKVTESNVTFEYEITGLEVFTNYSVRVKAFTSVGESKVASNFVTTTEDSKFFNSLCVDLRCKLWKMIQSLNIRTSQNIYSKHLFWVALTILFLFVKSRGVIPHYLFDQNSCGFQI